jgi:predicted phosphodiesterase
MKIWFISDTHNRHAELNVPTDVDLVIHCGDESETGEPWLNELEARDFLDWYSALAIPAKILVPGNHSTAIEKGLIRVTDYPQVHLLIHAFWEHQGLTIFGSPYTPEFFKWAYMRPRPELDSYWQTIPADVDILVTHGPPKGVLDVAHDFHSGEPVHVGSKSLTRQVKQRIRPRIHAFGHIHDGFEITNFGTESDGTTQFINCACCGATGQLDHHGIVIDIAPKE